jgi:formylglycine-generating enzyme required for sulfatase activity
MVKVLVCFALLLATGVAAAPLLKTNSVVEGPVSREGLLTSNEQRAHTILAGIQSVAAPEPGEIFRDCPDCPEMVVVPSGEFDMGGREIPSEMPPHHVAIAKPFAIGRRETTFAEWDACVSDGNCKYRPDDRGWGRGNLPVIDVSWEDAKAFIGWLSQKTGRKYRLPSEAEWEYAARAGTTSMFWWGREVGTANANCDNCSNVPPRKAMATGSFRPNGFGLYDTSGNAYEWVEDCWNETYNKAPKDGSAWTSGQCGLHVLRGGSFANKSNAATSAARFRYDVDVRYYTNGFRVARDLQ